MTLSAQRCPEVMDCSVTCARLALPTAAFRSLATSVSMPLGSVTPLGCRLPNVRMACTDGCSTVPLGLQEEARVNDLYLACRQHTQVSGQFCTRHQRD